MAHFWVTVLFYQRIFEKKTSYLGKNDLCRKFIPIIVPVELRWAICGKMAKYWISDGEISSSKESLNCMDVKRATRGKCIQILVILVFYDNNKVIDFLKILIYMYMKQTNNRRK